MHDQSCHLTIGKKANKPILQNVNPFLKKCQTAAVSLVGTALNAKGPKEEKKLLSSLSYNRTQCPPERHLDPSHQLTHKTSSGSSKCPLDSARAPVGQSPLWSAQIIIWCDVMAKTVTLHLLRQRLSVFKPSQLVHLDTLNVAV